MKLIFRFMTFRSFGVIVALAALGGCATVPRTSCELFEQVRASIDYDTVYRYIDAETRQAASFIGAATKQRVAAHWYTLRVSHARIRPCDHLYLVKDLYLRRPAGGALALYEQRDFYTARGQLIATKREDVTRQLRTAGFYSASVPLPIPRNAPAGLYRVVTRLIAKTANRAEEELATASADFRVVP